MTLTQVSTGGIKDGQVQTADIADAQITAAKLHADALDRTYTLGADGSNHYTFTGEGLTGAVNDPTLYLTRGKTYRFVNGNSGGAHPFRIQTTVNGSAGTEYNTGVTNNGGAGGSTIIFEVPHAAPDVLYYQCTSHGAMGGILYVTGALADGTVTTAKIAAGAVTTSKLEDGGISTAKLSNDAVTGAKIADDAIDSEHYADGSIDTAHIADAQITSAKLGTSAVTTGKINDQAVTAAKIADTTITSGQLAASSVTTSKINDGAVTDAKITGMAASKLTGALPAISGASLTNLPAGGQARNLVINGNFKVAQRGTSHGSSGYRTVDRWKMSAGGASAALTQSKYSAISGTSPYAEGHHQAYRIENAGQNTNSSGYVNMEHHIEAQDIINSGWNYLSSSSYITLSFWVRASVTQSYLVNINTGDGTVREWNHLVSLTADNWTKVTMTIPGDSNITINNDNGIGLSLYFFAHLGSAYTSGSTVDQWVNHAGYTSRPDMGTTWWVTSNSTFMLTGVQLEAGNTASDFAHESFAETLRKCQRYLFRLGNNSPSTQTIVNGLASSSTNVKTLIPYPQEMRATPTFTYEYLTIDDDVASYNSNRISGFNSTVGGTDRGQINFDVTGTSGGRFVRIQCTQAGGYIQGDAEL